MTLHEADRKQSRERRCNKDVVEKERFHKKTNVTLHEAERKRLKQKRCSKAFVTKEKVKKKLNCMTGERALEEKTYE